MMLSPSTLTLIGIGCASGKCPGPSRCVRCRGHHGVRRGGIGPRRRDGCACSICRRRRRGSRAPEWERWLPRRRRQSCRPRHRPSWRIRRGQQRLAKPRCWWSAELEHWTPRFRLRTAFAQRWLSPANVRRIQIRSKRHTPCCSYSCLHERHRPEPVPLQHICLAGYLLRTSLRADRSSLVMTFDDRSIS